MTFEAGTIVLVPFPFSNLKSRKRRPAVVVSRADYNNRNPDAIVCAMTSNLSNAAHSVLVSQRDLVDGRLPVDSRVKADKLATLDQAMMRPIGRLRPGLLAQLCKELVAVLPPEARP